GHETGRGDRRRGGRPRARRRREGAHAAPGRGLALRQAEVGPILLVVAVAEQIEQARIGRYDQARRACLLVLLAQPAPGLAVVRHLDRGPAFECARELLALAESRDRLDGGAESLRRLAQADHTVGQAGAAIARGLEQDAAAVTPRELERRVDATGAVPSATDGERQATARETAQGRELDAEIARGVEFRAGEGHDEADAAGDGRHAREEQPGIVSLAL